MAAPNPRRAPRYFVDGLARHSQAICDLGDLPAVLDHGHDCPIALFHDADLHQVHRTPPSSDRFGTRRPRAVNDQPEPLSTISRNTCKPSDGAA
jgi:hypothetical protein